MWELAADGPGDPDLFSARALEQALGSTDRSLAGALATFGAWNLAPAAFYEEGAAYPHAPVSAHHRVSAGHPMAGWSTLSLNHLSTGSISFEPGSTGNSSLRFSLDGPPRGTGSAARILIFLRSGFLRLVPVTLDAEGDADITVPFSSGQVSRVVLVVANAEHGFPVLDRCGVLVQRALARGWDAVPLPGHAGSLSVRRRQSSSALVGNGRAIGS